MQLRIHSMRFANVRMRQCISVHALQRPRKMIEVSRKMHNINPELRYVRVVFIRGYELFSCPDYPDILKVEYTAITQSWRIKVRLARISLR